MARTKLKKETKITLTAEALLKLLGNEAWHAAHGSPGYASGCSVFADDPDHSPENAESFLNEIQNAGGTLDTASSATAADLLRDLQTVHANALMALHEDAATLEGYSLWGECPKERTEKVANARETQERAYAQLKAFLERFA